MVLWTAFGTIIVLIVTKECYFDCYLIKLGCYCGKLINYTRFGIFRGIEETFRVKIYSIKLFNCE